MLEEEQNHEILFTVILRCNIMKLGVCQLLTVPKGPSRSFCSRVYGHTTRNTPDLIRSFCTRNLLLNEISQKMAVAVTIIVMEFGLSSLNRKPIGAENIERRRYCNGFWLA